MDLSCSKCDVMSLYFCGVLLMYQFVLFVACLTVFANCFEQFAMCLTVIAVLLLNVMDVYSVGGDALLDRPWYGLPQNVCVVPVIPVCI